MGHGVIRGGYNFLIVGGFLHDDSWPRATSREVTSTTTRRTAR